jgi:hypothetical protein
MRNGLIEFMSAVALAATAVAGCASTGGSGGTGGSSSSGGTVGTGGNASTGGGPGSGGASSTGGAPGTGGASATGGGGGAAVTTLSGSKAVNALSATEATQLCNDSYAYFSSAIPKATTCHWVGLAYAASSSAPDQAMLQQGCTMHENACDQAGDPWAVNSGCNTLPTTCTATVAQYSACVTDEVASFSQAVDGLSACASLAGTSSIIDVMVAAPPASCASLMDACPDLYPPSPLNINP